MKDSLGESSWNLKELLLSLSWQYIILVEPSLFAESFCETWKYHSNRCFFSACTRFVFALWNHFVDLQSDYSRFFAYVFIFTVVNQNMNMRENTGSMRAAYYSFILRKAASFLAFPFPTHNSSCIVFLNFVVRMFLSNDLSIIFRSVQGKLNVGILNCSVTPE